MNSGHHLGDAKDGPGVGTEKKEGQNTAPVLGPQIGNLLRVGVEKQPLLFAGVGNAGMENGERLVAKCPTYMPHERQPDQLFCVPSERKESGHSMSHDNSKTGPPGGPKIGPQTAKANNGAFQFAGLFWGPPGGPILGPQIRNLLRWGVKKRPLLFCQGQERRDGKGRPSAGKMFNLHAP